MILHVFVSCICMTRKHISIKRSVLMTIKYRPVLFHVPQAMLRIIMTYSDPSFVPSTNLCRGYKNLTSTLIDCDAVGDASVKRLCKCVDKGNI